MILFNICHEIQYHFKVFFNGHLYGSYAFIVGAVIVSALFDQEAGHVLVILDRKSVV